MIQRLKQAWCGLHGHQMFLHYAPSKLSLKCGLCARESRGWDIKLPPLRPMTVGVDLAHGKDRSNVVTFRRRA